MQDARFGFEQQNIELRSTRTSSGPVGQTPHHFDIRYSEFDILLFKKESPLTFKRRPALSAPFRILPAPRITS